MEIGERTIIDLDIHGLNPYLVKMVGGMRFRSSYGQNLLKHSIETANLCATMASELGLNPKQVKMAKRAGLLHDIGKVTEEESEPSHALLGMQLCEKYGEHAVIQNAVGAHHDEIEMNNIISPIIQGMWCYFGSQTRSQKGDPGIYPNASENSEELAMSYDGVQKPCHAGWSWIEGNCRIWEGFWWFCRWTGIYHLSKIQNDAVSGSGKSDRYPRKESKLPLPDN